MKVISTVIFILILTTENFFPQATTLKLSTKQNDASSFIITDSDNVTMFKLNADGGFYAKSVLGFGVIPVSGSGDRVMWHPYKAAFRAGSVNGNSWDDSNAGFYSTAFGFNTKAMSIGTFAGGNESISSGNYAFSFGNYNTSSGTASFSMGSNCIAMDFTSIALGYHSKAEDQGSVAIGYRTRADGDYSVALGHRATTAGHSGCFVAGDASTTDSIESSANNQLSFRYAGGYRLHTNATLTTGVSLNAGGSSWNVISDSTKKENFIKADGEYFLSSLSKLRLGSWNYKVQDPVEFRHYGPMAQEIFNYFGKDEFGTIGNDTTLASADIDGIMMICLQALEKRTGELKKAEERIADLERVLSQQSDRISAQQTMIESFQNEFYELKKAVYYQNEKKKEIKAELTINK